MMHQSWKTTVMGGLIAMAIAIQPLFESGSYDYKKLAFAAAVALFGYLAKDKDVSSADKK